MVNIVRLPALPTSQETAGQGITALSGLVFRIPLMELLEISVRRDFIAQKGPLLPQAAVSEPTVLVQGIPISRTVSTVQLENTALIITLQQLQVSLAYTCWCEGPLGTLP